MDKTSITETGDSAPDIDLTALREQATLLKELSDAAKAAYDKARRTLNDHTPPGSTFRPTIETGDPLDVAPVVLSSVVTTMPRKGLMVVDPDLFGHWVLDDYPDEAQVTATEPFMKRLRDLAKQHGRICGPRGETEIPGVVMGVGSSYTYVSKINHDLIPILWERLRDQLPTILELEG